MFPQPSSGAKIARHRALVALFTALILLITSAACKRSNVESNTNTANSASAPNDTSATPPFSTREPERYQWTSITTVSLGDQASPAGAPPANTTTSQVFVARDGERRREDYELSPGMKISFLQLPEGRYRLLHSKKVYAELKPDESAGANAPSQNVPPDFSPDKLLNASRTEARYEKLGAEEVNGRMATKYRVTVKQEIGEAKEAVTGNLVWVDESLGVPVKTETTSPNGSRYTMELRDIKLEVDAAIFALPPDYKKIESRDIDNEMLSTYLLGGDSEENRKENTQAKKK